MYDKGFFENIHVIEVAWFFNMLWYWCLLLKLYNIRKIQYLFFLPLFFTIDILQWIINVINLKSQLVQKNFTENLR